MINSPIVCMVGLYKGRWGGMILAQITTALTGVYTVYKRPTDTLIWQRE